MFVCVCVLVLLRKEGVVRDNERWKESGAARGGANRPQDSPILQLKEDYSTEMLKIYLERLLTVLTQEHYHTC